MAKFKVNKTKDYTIMSNYHLKEKNMSLTKRQKNLKPKKENLI